MTAEVETGVETGRRIGLIGIGNAGQALLAALSATHTVHIFDRDTARCRDAAAQCGNAPIIAASVADLAASTDLILLSLPTPAASVEVACEMLAVLRSGTTILETSTVRPEDVEAIVEIVAPSGARVIDAAVIGGVHKLAAGQGVFLIGMREDEAGFIGEVLGGIAEELFYLNARGGGMRAKLVANGVSHTAYVLLVEAAALAAAQDIPMSVFYRLMERESGLMRPLTHRFGERLRAHDFAGGMSTINARKDSSLILDRARSLGVPLFAIQATHSVYEMAEREGLGELDYASLAKLWERWLGVSFAEDADGQ